MAQVNVTDILLGEATSDVEFNGKSISVTHNPNAYTPDIEAGWARMEKDGWMGPVLSDFICRLVVRWTLLGDYDLEAEKFVVSDEMYPIEPVKIGKLPLLLLAEIVNKITEDSQPGR